VNKKAKTDRPSKIRGMTEFKKQWGEFEKIVNGGSLMLLVSMQAEIERKLKQMKNR
jgi:hypothetical protein